MRLKENVYIVASGALGFGITHPTDCHVYAIDDGASITLVDCGSGVDIDAMLREMRADRLDPDRLRYVLLTHKHADHAGAAAKLADRFGVEIVGSRHTVDVVRDADETRASLSVAKAGNPYPTEYHLYPCARTRVVGAGPVTLGQTTWEVLEVPGHAEGHTAYLFQGKAARYLFTGDALLFGGMV